jgi:hypothetical protein
MGIAIRLGLLAIKIIKSIPFILRIKRKFFPYHLQSTFQNFRILTFNYNQFSSMKKRSCIDALGNPIPWYTYPAIEYLKNLDFSDRNIFEYGSGNSSLWWGKRCKKIISIELDVKWFEQIKNSKSKISNFDYRLAIDEKSYVMQADLVGSDVIIIDGSWRVECANFVINQIKSNKVNPNMLIFDNSDWYPRTIPFINKNLKSWVQVDFSGFGPINGYTWITSIFINPNADSKLIYKTALTTIGGIEQTAEE